LNKYNSLLLQLYGAHITRFIYLAMAQYSDFKMPVE